MTNPDTKRGITKVVVVGSLVVAFGVIALLWAWSAHTYANEGTRLVCTKWGKIEQVIGPEDGSVFLLSPGWDKYEINVRSFTQKATARVTSKDNAALQVEVAVTGATENSKEAIADYFRQFGPNQDERHKRRSEVIEGLIQTEARNAFAEYGAYEVYANQEGIQKRIIESIRPQLSTQLHIKLESVQLGNPDFLDDRIEQSASAVVANVKQKEAEEARYQAAVVAAKTKEIEARTFQDPNLFKIRMLELELERTRVMAEGIARHQGPLYLGGNGLGLQAVVPKD